MAYASHTTAIVGTNNPNKQVSKNAWEANHTITLEADENFVIDAEKIVIGNTLGTNTGDFNSNRFVPAEIDFMGLTNGTTNPWVFSGAGSTIGTHIPIAGSANHPGIVEFVSSVASNSGYILYISQNAFLLAGGEGTELIFRHISNAATTIKFGFHDSVSVSPPVDGAFINISGDTLNGRTAKNSTSSTTGTNYTLVATTWYRTKILLNSDATRVDYYLYDCATGALLWTNYLTTNIPTTAGREVGHAVVATNSGTTAVGLIDCDYMNMWIDRVLVR